jgi:hypothetical protein
VGFKPTILATGRPQTHALDRATREKSKNMKENNQRVSAGLLWIVTFYLQIEQVEELKYLKGSPLRFSVI